MFTYSDVEIKTESQAGIEYEKIKHLFSFFRSTYSKGKIVDILIANKNNPLKKIYVAKVYVKNEVVAFSIFERFKIKKLRAIYFIFASVLPKYRDSGAYSFLVSKRIEKHFPQLIIGRPHNPIIYYSLSKLANKVYPDIQNKSIAINSGFYDSILQILTKGNKNFDSNTCAIKNAFDYDANYKMTLSPSDKVNDYFKRHIGNRNALLMLVDLT